MLRQYGLDIRSTGGETADVGDIVRTIIVDSTVTARMRRMDVVDNAKIRAGDVIVGLPGICVRTRRPTRYSAGWR